MGWLIGILLVIIGGVIGFFLSRYAFPGGRNSSALASQLADTQQQFDAYRRDVADHMATARLLSEQVAEVQSKLDTFLGDSEQILQSDKEWQEPLPFFAEGTMQELRQSNLLETERRRSRSNETKPRLDEAPLDYSEPGSGIFSAPDKEKS
ncbi:DUF1043 domain-containing protein [Aliidiomarina taiwanensis]|uniref:Z-ring associated protein G n=1 Tax=Aliidiomarina taiwanensis TaxID=946228 RepID=A0A432X7V5_9GAMM|nr:DUF1043 family protein [Aliidiomarina taiwanensis]RUO42867.1 DUF1043 domain-containing protein [Aliidiomarina taiwanensis]